jgi:hypothetical protein
MKYTAILTAATLVLTSNLSFAGNKRPQCHSITGNFAISVDNNCPILTAPERNYWYQESSFLFESGVPNTCFKGELTASLAGLEIKGVSYSAMTLNSFPSIDNMMAFTAISLVEVTTKEGWPLGKLITKDTGIQDNTTYNANEILSISDGSSYFKNASGTIQIDGPSLLGSSEVSGSICLKR